MIDFTNEGRKPWIIYTNECNLRATTYQRSLKVSVPRVAMTNISSTGDYFESFVAVYLHVVIRFPLILFSI